MRKIVLYEKANHKPVEDFFKSLQPHTVAKLIRQLELLEEFGPNLGMPNAKPLGDGLYELRVRGKQEVRVLYIYARRHRIYLLHAFIKKTNAISQRNLGIAQKRKLEITTYKL